jgi:hypothetical protein
MSVAALSNTLTQPRTFYVGTVVEKVRRVERATEANSWARLGKADHKGSGTPLHRIKCLPSHTQRRRCSLSNYSNPMC